MERKDMIERERSYLIIVTKRKRNKIKENHPLP